VVGLQPALDQQADELLVGAVELVGPDQVGDPPAGLVQLVGADARVQQLAGRLQGAAPEHVQGLAVGLQDLESRIVGQRGQAEALPQQRRPLLRRRRRHRADAPHLDEGGFDVVQDDLRGLLVLGVDVGDRRGRLAAQPVGGGLVYELEAGRDVPGRRVAHVKAQLVGRQAGVEQSRQGRGDEDHPRPEPHPGPALAAPGGGGAETCSATGRGSCASASGHPQAGRQWA